MLFVLDTNVLSEFMRPEPDGTFMRWFETHPQHEFASATICQAEIISGLAALPKGKRKLNLLAAAQWLWTEQLDNRILPFDQKAANSLLPLLEVRRRKGQPIQFVDAVIAATCVAHNAGILTRDTAGFLHTGIEVINPWSEKHH